MPHYYPPMFCVEGNPCSDGGWQCDRLFGGECYLCFLQECDLMLMETEEIKEKGKELIKEAKKRGQHITKKK